MHTSLVNAVVLLWTMSNLLQHLSSASTAFTLTRFSISYLNIGTATLLYHPSCALSVDSISPTKPSQPKLLNQMKYKGLPSWMELPMKSWIRTCSCLLMKPHGTKELLVGAEVDPLGDCAAFSADILFEGNGIPFFQSSHLMVSSPTTLFLVLSHLPALFSFCENSSFHSLIHILAPVVSSFWITATFIMPRRFGFLLKTRHYASWFFYLHTHTISILLSLLFFLSSPFSDGIHTIILFLLWIRLVRTLHQKWPMVSFTQQGTLYNLQNTLHLLQLIHTTILFWLF